MYVGQVRSITSLWLEIVGIYEESLLVWCFYMGGLKFYSQKLLNGLV